MQKKQLLSMVLMLFVGLSLLVPDLSLAVEQAQGRRARMEAAAGRKAGPQAGQGKKAANPDPAQAKGAGSDVSPGQINARAAILVEVSTGMVLFEQNADEIIEPASFTKVLSLYLIFEGMQQGRIHLNDEVWVSETAWRTGGSKMFVGIGTKVPLEELLKGIAVVSGNDACVAASEHLAGSIDTFVDAMNRKAQELGMSKSHFINPHGLPAEGQITTARDMATLDVAYIRNFPEALKYHSMREYSYNNINQYNRNHLLLKDQSVDGLKTGFVGAAGYHLAATAQRDGMRLLAVVMGAATPAVREREAMKLLNYGFRQYSLVQPFPQGQPLTTVKVWKGQKDELGLYPQEAAAFLIPQAQRKLLRWEVNAPSNVTAPIQAQQSFGEVVFYVSDQPKRTVPLVAREDVALGGWFKRTWQSVFQLATFDWRWLSGILGGLAVLFVLFLFVSSRRSGKRSKSSFSK